MRGLSLQPSPESLYLDFKSRPKNTSEEGRKGQKDRINGQKCGKGRVDGCLAASICQTFSKTEYYSGLEYNEQFCSRVLLGPAMGELTALPRPSRWILGVWHSKEEREEEEGYSKGVGWGNGMVKVVE